MHSLRTSFIRLSNKNAPAAIVDAAAAVAIAQLA
jgi:hypothetical protein